MQMAFQLQLVRDGIWFLAGMLDEYKAELILTAEGVVKNMVFVEELVSRAPQLNHWKFTALKPTMESHDFHMEMEGIHFKEENMGFYPVIHPEMPDEIDITVGHPELSADNSELITTGVYLILDSLLGELQAATAIDNITVVNRNLPGKDWIPLSKLPDFLKWREAEFIEKYQGFRYNTEDDNYASLEARLENGQCMLAVINLDLLKWDAKASHPWILSVILPYEAEKTGMPDKATYTLFEQFENELLMLLQPSGGYLHIGRQTGDSVREIYFACTEFRKPSKVLDQLEYKYHNRLAIDFDLYKDKYWITFKRFASL